MKNGQRIKLRYQLFTEDKILVASNLDDALPQEFFIGRGQLMPALEDAIRTMKLGEKRSVFLTSEQAFGEPRTEFVKRTRLSKIPEKQRVIGNILDMEDAEGNICSARIHAIEENDVILDFNHPLAGQGVFFELELLAFDD